MSEMSRMQIRKFLNKGTFTGKLATVKKDGSSHVVPIWFVLDYRNNEDKIGTIFFTTFVGSVKAENIQRDNRISICIYDQTPPFTFVTIHGTAMLYPYKQKEVLKWATRIAKRYMVRTIQRHMVKGIVERERYLCK
jgi:PPOX class probable F420-dependent enzyme